MKIFLSHNYKDKAIVEPIAFKIAEEFGVDQVFYDDWSIQPGDGIISKMNEGMTAPEFFFFFVSKDSVNSKMVQLEWQNALYQATNQKTKIIPIRVDENSMPALLLQNLYIDLHSIGIDATADRMISVVKGDNSLTKKYADFDNVTWTSKVITPDEVHVTIIASKMIEHDPDIVIAHINAAKDIIVWIKDAPGIQTSWHDFPGEDGTTIHGTLCKPALGGPLKPGFPRIYIVRSKSKTTVGIAGVLRMETPGRCKMIPSGNI